MRKLMIVGVLLALSFNVKADSTEEWIKDHCNSIARIAFSAANFSDRNVPILHPLNLIEEITIESVKEYVENIVYAAYDPSRTAPDLFMYDVYKHCVDQYMEGAKERGLL